MEQETWALDEVRQGYLQFIERFAPLAKSVASRDFSPEQAFVIRTLLIHAFRRVQLHDPKLPSSLLPGAWPGNESYAICSEIYRKTYEAAEAAPYFYERFGGLR